MESQVDPRFGRCAYFIIIDPESSEFEIIENSNAQTMGGAGIQAGQFISDKGVKTLLTGHVGPNAFQTLQANGIEIITGISGPVKEAVEQYKSGILKPTANPTVGAHSGMKRNK